MPSAILTIINSFHSENNFATLENYLIFMCNFVWTKLGIKTKQNVHSNDKTEVIWQSRAWSTFCVNQGSFINYFEKSVGLKVHHMRREYSD